MKKKFILFTVLAMVCAGLVFVGCKNKDDKDDEPEASFDPSEEDDIAAAEALLADKYFWGESHGIADGLDGNYADSEFQFYFNKDHLVTISSWNEIPWTIKWSIDKNRKVTFKLSSKDPNNMYGELKGEVSFGGQEIAITGKNSAGKAYTMLLKPSQEIVKRLFSNIGGLHWYDKKSAKNASGPIEYHLFSYDSKTLQLTHANELPLLMTFEITDPFNTDYESGNLKLTVSNADEKMGSKSNWPEKSFEWYYGKIVKASINLAATPRPIIYIHFADDDENRPVLNIDHNYLKLEYSN